MVNVNTVLPTVLEKPQAVPETVAWKPVIAKVAPPIKPFWPTHSAVPSPLVSRVSGLRKAAFEMEVVVTESKIPSPRELIM